MAFEQDVIALRRDLDNLLRNSGSNITAEQILEDLLTIDGSGSGLDADKLDGYQYSDILTVINSKLDSSVYTASDILNKLLTVDGSESGLDADKLDGHEASVFLQASSYTAADILSKLLTVDGSGSGLDADKLDGVELSDIYSKYDLILLGTDNLNDKTTTGTYYQRSDANATSGRNYPITNAGILSVYFGSSWITQKYIRYSDGITYVRYHQGWDPIGWSSWKRTDGMEQSKSLGTEGGYYVFHTGLKICWGKVTITPVANTPTTASVTFPITFNSNPALFGGAVTSVPGTQVTGYTVASTSTTGCVCYLTRTNTTATSMYWLAIGV